MARYTALTWRGYTWAMHDRPAGPMLLRAIALWAASLLPAADGWGEEPTGFGGYPWGATWQAATIDGLPGCEKQGELVTDVDGFVVRVAQPECVGYLLSDHERVNLILLYPDIRWHSPDRARAVVDGLVSMPRLWGLRPDTVARLQRVSNHLAVIASLRPLYGADGPAVPYLEETMALPASARGLQGYQINFTPERYDRVRAAAFALLGTPSGRGLLARATPAGPRGEVLEWVGTHTVAILRQRGPLDESGYLLVLTRTYLALLDGLAGPAERRTPPPGLPKPNPTSYAWFLEIVEDFPWARNATGGSTP